jgi:hypothetical protein
MSFALRVDGFTVGSTLSPTASTEPMLAIGWRVVTHVTKHGTSAWRIRLRNQFCGVSLQ